jgi:hypothetical protein
MKFFASLNRRLSAYSGGRTNTAVATNLPRDYTASERDLLRRQLQQNNETALTAVRKAGITRSSRLTLAE